MNVTDKLVLQLIIKTFAAWTYICNKMFLCEVYIIPVFSIEQMSISIYRYAMPSSGSDFLQINFGS